MKPVEKSTKTKDSYKPSSTLTSYLEEKLQLLKLEQEFKMRGKPLSDKDQKKKELNQRKRVHVLNRHIFESMANLVTFFEFIIERGTPEFLEDFEDDIRELLLGVGPDKIEGKTQTHSREYVFIRFIQAIMHWNEEKHPNNFRLVLLTLMQWNIVLNMISLSHEQFGTDMTNNVITPDLFRAYAWVKFYSRNADKMVEMEEHHRPVLF